MHSTIERSTIAVVAILGFNIAQLLSCYAQSFPTDSSDASGTLARLAIGVPRNVAADAAIHQPLEELGRERCDKEAISHLAKALDQAGYRREAAVAQVNFSSQCGGYAPALRGAVNMLLKLSDYTTAEHIASDLIRLEPFSDNGYFLRALAHDGNKSFKSAIDDYVTAIEMFGNKDRINSVGYYNMARDYERLGQFCDAMLPIERWVALDPSRHDTTQTRAMLSDYAAKGGCAAASSGGTETFPAAGPGRVVKVSVLINNVSGTFILDTGASYVVMKASFAEKAKIDLEQGSTVRLHTANGVVDGKRGRADMIQLRSLKARGVPVVIEADDSAAYGAEGLLGLSFLSRFNLTIDGSTVKIAAGKPQ
jgi:clan AA aspartic protease (TIGR02281 family)